MGAIENPFADLESTLKNLSGEHLIFKLNPLPPRWRHHKIHVFISKSNIFRIKMSLAAQQIEIRKNRLQI